MHSMQPCCGGCCSSTQLQAAGGHPLPGWSWPHATSSSSCCFDAVRRPRRRQRLLRSCCGCWGRGLRRGSREGGSLRWQRRSHRRLGPLHQLTASGPAAGGAAGPGRRRPLLQLPAMLNTAGQAPRAQLEKRRGRRRQKLLPRVATLGSAARPAAASGRPSRCCCRRSTPVVQRCSSWRSASSSSSSSSSSGRAEERELQVGQPLHLACMSSWNLIGGPLRQRGSKSFMIAVFCAGNMAAKSQTNACCSGRRPPNAGRPAGLHVCPEVPAGAGLPPGRHCHSRVAAPGCLHGRSARWAPLLRFIRLCPLALCSLFARLFLQLLPAGLLGIPNSGNCSSPADLMLLLLLLLCSRRRLPCRARPGGGAVGCQLRDGQLPGGRRPGGLAPGWPTFPASCPCS